MSDQKYRYLRMTIDVVVFDDETAEPFVAGDALGADLERAIKFGSIEVDGISDVEVH